MSSEPYACSSIIGNFISICEIKRICRHVIIYSNSRLDSANSVIFNLNGDLIYCRAIGNTVYSLTCVCFLYDVVEGLTDVCIGIFKSERISAVCISCSSEKLTCRKACVCAVKLKSERTVNKLLACKRLVSAEDYRIIRVARNLVSVCEIERIYACFATYAYRCLYTAHAVIFNLNGDLIYDSAVGNTVNSLTCVRFSYRVIEGLAYVFCSIIKRKSVFSVDIGRSLRCACECKA